MVKNRRVVVADGDANLRPIIARALRELRLEVLTATCGAEAVELMAWRPVPGILLTASRLPDMSGDDLERIMREADNDVLVVTYDARTIRKESGLAMLVTEMRRRLNLAA